MVWVGEGPYRYVSMALGLLAISGLVDLWHVCRQSLERIRPSPPVLPCVRIPGSSPYHSGVPEMTEIWKRHRPGPWRRGAFWSIRLGNVSPHNSYSHVRIPGSKPRALRTVRTSLWA